MEGGAKGCGWERGRVRGARKGWRNERVGVRRGGGGGADVMLDMCVCPYIPAECT